MKLPRWMRVDLGATAAMNLVGASAFVPGLSVLREKAGIPLEGHPLYLWIIAEFIFIFGAAYAYCAITARAPRVFISVAAAGKLAFFATILGFWLVGDLPMMAVLVGSGDLIFGCVFLVWLAQTRGMGE